MIELDLVRKMFGVGELTLLKLGEDFLDAFIMEMKREKRNHPQQETPSMQQESNFVSSFSLRDGRVPYALTLFFQFPDVQIVLLEEVIEIGPMFSCKLGGLAHIALAELQEMDEIGLFKGISGLFERFHGLLRGDHLFLENKIFCDEILLGHGHGIFDGVFQFPDIARPVVEEEFLHGQGRQALSLPCSSAVRIS